MNKTLVACQNVYDCLQDDISKLIFENRVLYSLTNNIKKIQNVIRLTEEGRQVEKIIMSGDNNYIFGGGIWGKEMVEAWPGRWKGIIDNNDAKKGRNILGIKITNLNDIGKTLKDTSANIFICTRLYYKEIREQLLNYGLAEKSIINIGKIIDEMSKRQYFDLPYMGHDNNEVFLDVGSLDAVSSSHFVEWSKGRFDRIIVFEPDFENVKKCEKTLANLGVLDKARIIPKGCWNEKGKLRFNSCSSGGSSFVLSVVNTDDNYDEVKVTTIDSELEREKVTFIKMDIEGAEYNALLGAEKIIRKQKPKLAISVYHKKEDIFQLPELVLKFNPGYRLYLRHYSLAGAETVLYAI